MVVEMAHEHIVGKSPVAVATRCTSRFPERRDLAVGPSREGDEPRLGTSPGPAGPFV
jgi:hypothetical protein